MINPRREPKQKPMMTMPIVGHFAAPHPIPRPIPKQTMKTTGTVQDGEKSGRTKM